jgi:rhamnogalacturonyl hydrolase YesR
MNLLPRSRLTAAVTAAMLVSGPLAAEDNTALRRDVEEAMRRSNDYFISTYPIGTATWNRSAYHAGNFRAWSTLGVTEFLDRSLAWATANAWLTGPDAADADAEACGQTYIDLYQTDPQPVRIAAIKIRIDGLVADPQSEDDWWWIDAFFMAGPTFARLGVVESNTAYFVQLEKMYLHMKDTRELFDPAHGLWYRDAEAKARTGPNTPEFWGRGNGWVIAGCARVLEQLPPGDSRRPELEGMLQTMAGALLPLQGTDGFWRSNLMFPNHVPNPETSCTAFFTYAIAYGINEGLLDPATYTPVVMSAWTGLTSVAQHPDGLLAYVQAIGRAPNPATYYDQQDYAYGAFLLAGAEILRMSGGPAPIFADTGPDQTLIDSDTDQVETVTLNAGRTSVRSGGISRFSWWMGTTYLGAGAQLTIDFPRGSHEVTLQAETLAGETLANTTNISVNPPGIKVTAIGNQTGYPPENTLDGLLTTRWSQSGDDQWIRYELPSTTTLDHVDIAFYRGDQRNYYFELEVSDDGESWSTVFSGQSGGTTAGLETFSFPARSARFLQYLGYGNSTNFWNNITELSIPQGIIPVDGDANGLPDAWEIHHLGSTGQNPDSDPNGDGVTLEAEFILGADPVSQNSNLLQIGRDASGHPVLTLNARAAFGPGYVGRARKFRVQTSSTLGAGDWHSVPGWESITGDNLPRTLAIPEDGGRRFYQVSSWLE